MRIFLSHASEDKDFVRAVQAALPPHVHVWLDTNELYAGHKLSDSLRRAVLDDTDYLVVFVSPRSLASAWVARELGWALEREADLGRPFVVPMMLAGTLEAKPPEAFAPMWSRIYVVCSDDAAKAGADLARHLFALVSEWIESISDSSRLRFIASLRDDLTRFKDTAHLMLAMMRNPIEVLGGRPEVHAELLRIVGDYGSFSAEFIDRLDRVRARVRELFGGNLVAAADKLLDMVESELYRSKLYELNKVVAMVNAYDEQLSRSPKDLSAANKERERLLAAAELALKPLRRRSLTLIAKLERE